jgi:phosphoglucosamine mutase
MLKLGWAAGRVLAREGSGHVVIGKDTRISGYLFEAALEAGLASAGVNITLTGPMPTPGIAYLARTFRAWAGIVISASHNSYQDNGIKFFSAQGTKLADEVEAAIEAQLDQPMTTVGSAELGKADRLHDAAGRYIEFCKSTIPSRINLKGLRIVVDCAHGATYHIAPSVFTELGAEVIAIGVSPDGLNINKGYGSTSPEALQERVKKERADLGIAFDGDGDRVAMVDQDGELIDGDEILYMIAASRQRHGKLSGSVVGTVMSNLGLEHALRDLGISFERTPVGDRYVLSRLEQDGWSLGGESSGHIICLDRTSTGDGIVAALQVLAEMVDSGQGLKELRSGMYKYPQHMINVQRPPGFDLDASSRIEDALGAAQSRLNGNGRVLLRPSGTEPLVRVMVEGPERALVIETTEILAVAVREAIAEG